VNRGFVVLVAVTGPGQRSSSSRVGGRLRWKPARLVKDEDLAHAMVRLLRERSPNVDARVVPLDRLAAELGSEEAEWILDRLYNLTTADTAWAQELESEAVKRPLERRSGVDRRVGERRKVVAAGLPARVERRTGVDRREQQPLSLA
jgi:hypothetical protein